MKKDENNKMGRHERTDRATNMDDKTKNDPPLAPTMEMDELEVDATSEEIKKGDYTPVTKLFIDRVD